MHSGTELPITLKPSKLRSLGWLCVFAAFTVTGVWMSTEKPLIGYLCSAFFGLGFVVFTINLLPKSSYLELTENGFTMCSLFRKSTTKWTDVEGFSVIEIAGNEMVSWYYSENYEKQQTGRAISRAISASEAALPDTYGMKAKDLADLMNELVERQRRT